MDERWEYLLAFLVRGEEKVDMLIDHSREKLIQAVVYFAKNTKYCGLTKLMKLLYFLDFKHFRETGKSVTGLYYDAFERGPLPLDFYKELVDPHGLPEDLAAVISIYNPDEAKGFRKVVAKPKAKFDHSHFSEREERILKQVEFIFRYARARDMTESSHLRNEPWEVTLRTKGRRASIDYMLAVDEGKDALPREVVEERMAEMRQMKETFGGG